MSPTNSTQAALPARTTDTSTGNSLVTTDKLPVNINIRYSSSFQDLSDVSKEKIWRVLNVIILLASMVFIPFLVLVFFKNPAGMFFTGTIAGTALLTAVTKLMNLQTYQRNYLQIENRSSPV